MLKKSLKSARGLVPGLTHGREQGVAIVAVLALLALMSALAVTFLRMSMTARDGLVDQAEVERASSMKETVISLVTAQLAAANGQLSQKTTPDESISWTTQPGAVRTYSNSQRVHNKVFKLYSSPVPQISDIVPGETASLLDLVSEDLAADWQTRPDEFTDLNLPIVTNGKARYPIADPAMWNGSADGAENVEGFSYSPIAGKKNISGVDPLQGRLALPVRWIYQLQDGTLGILTKDRKFQSLDGKTTGVVSRENPVIGRMAWWADDESCKINVNTASVPAIWDTPRTTSKEDVWLANSQPLAGEFQRYPGHPATVDLSAVFFPGRRYTATDGTWAMSPGASMRGSLTHEQAQLIWDMAPFISSGLRNEEAGTLGGSRATPAGAAGIFTDATHLYASFEEAYFKTRATYPVSTDTGRPSIDSDGQDAQESFLHRLERSQFFLTARSSSMEMTNSGYPRVSIYPVDTSVLPYINTSSTAALPGTASPYDIPMAVSATLFARSYYFQRRDPNSRHAELYSPSGAVDPSRNVALFKYLKELTRLPLPGYPAGFAGSSPVQLTPSSAEDPNGQTLASKYPAGFNPASGGRFKDSGFNVQNGQTLMDASDRTQILLSMLDFCRSIGMQPAFVAPTSRYDSGYGQATGICGCGNDWGITHGSAMLFSNNTYRAPRGAGKLLIPSEIAMVINVAAKKQGSTTSSGDWNALINLMAINSPSKIVAANNDSSSTRYMIEIGFIMGAFNPRIGWAPVQPSTGLAISTTVANASDPLSAAGNESATAVAKGDYLPLIATLNGSRTERLKICGVRQASGGSSTSRSTATGLIPWGGMQGPRGAFSSTAAFSGYNIAICSPICIEAVEDQGTIQIPLTVDPNSVMRIMVTDGMPESFNVFSAVDLKLPQTFTLNLKAGLTGTTLSKQAINFANGSVSFPDNRCAIRSLVIPHGDYRLATPLRVEQDLFVAHAPSDTQLSYSFYESNQDRTKRQIASATYSLNTLINSKDVPLYLQAGTGTPVSGLPLPLPDPADLSAKKVLLNKTPDPDLTTHASRDPDRRETFAFGRRDGQGALPKRGSSDPDETGDFDNGPGAAEDGPYLNHPDEGDRRKNDGIRYFNSLTARLKTTDSLPAQGISPNFLIRSPIDFGSLPSGLQARVPWQTLRFRPDPGMNNSALTMRNPADNPPAGLPFANFCGPRDHFLLDMFWMPVAEPWSISTPGVTQGTINLNQQIFPFLYVNRTTALHALLRGERMLAIPNAAAEKYKKTTADGTPDNPDASYRYFLNTRETVKQFLSRYTEGRDPEGFPLAFNTFRSASELCEVWLVPDKNGDQYDGDHLWDLAWTIGRTDADARDGFWAGHRLTGDNSRERPYSNLYPRVTVRSNVFKLHLITQSLQSPRTGSTAGVATKPGAASPRASSGVVPNFTVSGEWRGSCVIERTFDPLDTRFRTIDYTNLAATAPNPAITPRLETLHSFTVSNVKAFGP